MVLHLKKTDTLNFDMEDRLSNLLDGNKAIQLVQEARDKIVDTLSEDDDAFALAYKHYDEFYSSTNPTLFDDLLNISETDAKQIVLKLILKK